MLDLLIEPIENSIDFYASNATKLFDKVMQSEGNRTRFEELMESVQAARNAKAVAA